MSSVFSKLISKEAIFIASSVTCCTIAWGLWYDHKRRNKPDYLDKLVVRRRKELYQEIISKDPLYSVKYGIDLCENFYEPEEYISEKISTGEKLLAEKKYNLAVAHIALALAYCEPKRRLNILTQISNFLPEQIMQLLGENLKFAFMRVSRQNEEYEKMIIEAGRKQIDSLLENSESEKSNEPSILSPSANKIERTSSSGSEISCNSSSGGLPGPDSVAEKKEKLNRGDSLHSAVFLENSKVDDSLEDKQILRESPSCDSLPQSVDDLD